MNKHLLKTISIITLACTLATFIYSCSMDSGNDHNMKVYNDFGEITYIGENGYFEITRDDKATMRVLEYSGQNKIEVGKRVFFKYSIITGNTQTGITAQTSEYTIKLLIFNNIITPQIVKESFLVEDTPHRTDSIGHDLIRVYRAGFSGNYINIEFEYFRYKGSNKSHLINLVWDNTRNPSDSVYLHIRHNAMGEIAGLGHEIVSATGLASFKLSELIPEGKETIDIKLRFNMDKKDGVGEYIEVDKWYTGTFKPYSETKTYIAGNELSPLANTSAFFD